MKKLLKLIGKYKIFLGFSVIFAAISVVLQLYVPVLFGDAIDEVVAADVQHYPCIFQSEKEDTGERSEECGDIRFYKRRSGSSD